MYSPISIQYTLSNTVTVKGSSSIIQPQSPFIPLTWNGSADGLIVLVNDVPSSDWSFDASTNTIAFTGTFAVNDLPVKLSIERLTDAQLPAQFSAGSLIRAKDLNGNFQHLLKRVEELEAK